MNFRLPFRTGSSPAGRSCTFFSLSLCAGRRTVPRVAHWRSNSAMIYSNRYTLANKVTPYWRALAGSGSLCTCVYTWRACIKTLIKCNIMQHNARKIVSSEIRPWCTPFRICITGRTCWRIAIRYRHWISPQCTSLIDSGITNPNESTYEIHIMNSYRMDRIRWRRPWWLTIEGLRLQTLKMNSSSCKTAKELASRTEILIDQ